MLNPEGGSSVFVRNLGNNRQTHRDAIARNTDSSWYLCKLSKRLVVPTGYADAAFGFGSHHALDSYVNGNSRQRSQVYKIQLYHVLCCKYLVAGFSS